MVNAEIPVAKAKSDVDSVNAFKVNVAGTEQKKLRQGVEPELSVNRGKVHLVFIPQRLDERLKIRISVF